MKILSRHLHNVVLFTVLITVSVSSIAQNIPEHAQGLNEELVSVDLSEKKKQVRVYYLANAQVA